MSNHIVFNQSQPLSNWNVYTSDFGLQSAVNINAVNLDQRSQAANSVSLTLLHQNLADFGHLIGQDHYLEFAAAARTHDPKLHTHDAKGFRRDVVEFHPAYHELMRTCIENGLGATAWGQKTSNNQKSHAHLNRAAKFLMHSGIESGVLCPISMTYAVVPALAHNNELSQAVMPKLFAQVYESSTKPWQEKEGITMGMGMTEKQGGSDVRANTTLAEHVKDSLYLLSGHKWFFSAPMCDAFLVLAQTTKGLSCFFVPSYLQNQVPTDALQRSELTAKTDSSNRNAIRIQRLKDKLGNRSNASSEVEFEKAQGWLVGEPGHGIATILEMGTITRIDCALGTAGLMRQALALAIDHCQQRNSFGKPLTEQPLMREVLADMVLESYAATHLAIRLAATLDQPNNQQETLLRRLVTPAAKFWVCKRGSLLAQEAMECLGGNGYVEEGSMAAIYREMPLNSIWEGAGNIMGLDILRGLRKRNSITNEPELISALKNEVSSTDGTHANLDLFKKRWFALWGTQLASENDLSETKGRQLATEIAIMMQAHLLCKAAYIVKTDPSAALVANAFCLTRLTKSGTIQPPYAFGANGLVPDAEALVTLAAPRGR